MSNQENNTAQNSVLNTIHKVEGFDPAAYAVPYVDLNTGETRKRLPVMAQMAWFRLVYREGKIAVSVAPGKDCFVATARVYPSYKDPADSYLAEATASRTFDPSKPSVSPREWAQTAAVGIALRNAGFGLQFGAAGDDFLNLAPNELGITVDPIPAGVPQESAPAPDGPATGTAPVAAAAEPPEPKRELTPEEKFLQASSVLWPTKKHAGRTLGQVMQMDPSAVEWLANRYDRNPDVSAAAKYMCEYALNHQSA